MKKDRKELEQNLIQVIEEIKYNAKNREHVNKYLLEYDIPAGFFNEIAKKNELISEIETPLLCLISMAVFDVSGEDKVRPENYFTDNEIEESKRFRVKIDESISLPIELNDVTQIDYDRYYTHIPMSKIVRWVNSKIIHYDFSHQRSPEMI